MKNTLIALIIALVCTAAYSAYAAKPKTETVTYTVNIHCQNCVNKLTDKLSFLKGVVDCKISLKHKTVNIQYNPDKIQEQQFVEIINKLGYTAVKQVARQLKVR